MFVIVRRSGSPQNEWSATPGKPEPKTLLNGTTISSAAMSEEMASASGRLIDAKSYQEAKLAADARKKIDLFTGGADSVEKRSPANQTVSLDLLPLNST